MATKRVKGNNKPSFVIPTMSILEGAMADARSKTVYTAGDWKTPKGSKKPVEMRMVKVKKAHSHKRELSSMSGGQCPIAAEVKHTLVDGRQVVHTIEVFEP